MRTGRVAVSVAAVGALLITACHGDSAGTASGSGTLSVVLTDGQLPISDVARVDLWIVRIDARFADTSSAGTCGGDDDCVSNDESVDQDSDNRDPSRGWVTIARPDRSINLFSLQNGTTTNLGQSTLPTGTYNAFRLILDTDRSSITLKDGTVLTGDSRPGIKFPSAGRTGIKIDLAEPIHLVENGTVMVLDFDLSKSFVVRGNSVEKNGVLFKPVIHAVARDITGSISGTVRQGTNIGPPQPAATVELLRAGTLLDDSNPANILATAITDASGNFLFPFVLPGTYALRATPPPGTDFGSVLVPVVTVQSQKTTGGIVMVLPLIARPPGH